MTSRNMHATIFRSRSKLPPSLLAVAFAFTLLFGFGPNTLLALFAVLALILGSALLWRPGESPILLLVFVYQWLQASARVFHANALNVDVVSLSYAGGQVALATILSLVGLLFLAVGLRAGAGPWRASDGLLCREMVLSRSIKAWFQLYAIASIGAAAALIIARYVPGLSQPLLATASLKWAFFWILAYATFVRQGADQKYLLTVFVFEFALSLGGYFSDFKTVFVVTILAMAAEKTNIRGKRLAAIFTLGGILLGVGILWTAVKSDYRHLASGGAQAQIVTIDYGARIATLIDLASDLEPEDLRNALDETALRIGYVDFFAVVLNRVPEVIPYEYGALWLDAIMRPFMPRILFPGKAPIHDSERSNYYTGLGVASYSSGTSISIGYMGEAYIDFGSIGMMVTIFLYGALLGMAYRSFISGPRTRGLYGMACITTILIGSSALESSITKVMGGLVASILVAYLLARLIVPIFAPWLVAGKHIKWPLDA